MCRECQRCVGELQKTLTHPQDELAALGGKRLAYALVLLCSQPPEPRPPDELFAAAALLRGWVRAERRTSHRLSC